MKSIPITKYHGLGNDFIITRYSYVENEDIVSFIRSVCDRHTGIGADGAIFVKTNPLEMVYYNQDGSRAPMCGNGIRCFAKYCFDENIDRSFEEENAAKLSTLTATAVIKARALEDALLEIKNFSDSLEQAKFYRDTVFSAMNELRIVIDEMETHTAASYWPYPSYGELLFSVK